MVQHKRYLRGYNQKLEGYEFVKNTVRRFGKGKRHRYTILVEKEKIKMFRFTISFNFPLHSKDENEYWGCSANIFSQEPDENMKEFLKQNTREFFLKWIKYPIKELWFYLKGKITEGQENWTEVEENNKMLNYWEKRIEDDDGMTIESDSGYYDKKKHA